MSQPDRPSRRPYLILAALVAVASIALGVASFVCPAAAFPSLVVLAGMGSVVVIVLAMIRPA